MVFEYPIESIPEDTMMAKEKKQALKENVPAHSTETEKSCPKTSTRSLPPGSS
jgi:hypothetical protein